MLFTCNHYVFKDKTDPTPPLPPHFFEILNIKYNKGWQKNIFISCKLQGSMDKAVDMWSEDWGFNPYTGQNSTIVSLLKNLVFLHGNKVAN
jgi:hypothetical protein